jgi:aspartate/methionine/tyrosine aminotransferase
MAAARHLIETVGVAAVPGDNFYGEGREGDRYLRFAFCRSLASLQEAARRLERLPSA